MGFERELADFRYYAVFKGSSLRVEDADMLVRKPQGYGEEQYAGHGLWVYTDKLYRLDTGRDWTDDYRAITEAEALELRQRIDTNWATKWHHHVLSDGGVPFAVVVTPKDAQATTRPYLIARHAHRGFEQTDLLDRVPHEPTWSAQTVGAQAAAEALARMEQRLAEQSGLTGGYAVFHTLIDVLDLDSAYAVVREPEREHEFTVRLSQSDADRLTERIRLRTMRQQAGDVDGHQHFGLFDRSAEATDPRNAHSVVRCAADGAQKWEVFLRPGEWLPTVHPSDSTPLLPLGPADLAAVTTRLAAGQRRHLRVRCREVGPVALVRLTGTTEEAANDLGWEPSDFLTRLPDEQSWYVAEESERSLAGYRFASALLRRSVRFHQDEYKYFAVFPTREPTFDLTQAVLVLRKHGDAEEEFAGPGGWVPSGPEPLDRKYLGRYLPISEQEMERLIS